MVVRLFVLVIAMFLVAAPVDAACDEPRGDATAQLVVADDLVCTQPLVVAPDVRATTLASRPGTTAVPPTPILAGIFRPPRPAPARTLQATV